MKDEVTGEPIDYTPWVEHIYAALRWAEGGVRRMHELLEHETVDDRLRMKVSGTIGIMEAARIEVFHAFEKMGSFNSDPLQIKLDLSAIGAETKVKVLELSAAYLRATLSSPRASESYESLREAVEDAARIMKEEAEEIAARLKSNLKGPDPRRE